MGWRRTSPNRLPKSNALSNQRTRINSGSRWAPPASSTPRYCMARHSTSCWPRTSTGPILLERDGFAVSGSRHTYAVGRLTLWSADPERVRGDIPALLASGSFRRLAMANPELAPYGAAAREVLRGFGLYAPLRDKIVTAENIGQTYAMVATGNAEIGFVAASGAPDTGGRQPLGRPRSPACPHQTGCRAAGARREQRRCARVLRLPAGQPRAQNHFRLRLRIGREQQEQ